MPFPNVLIIGAMKCGTTSLHSYLNKHPEVFMSEPKELHYYDSYNRMSQETYLNHFNSSKKINGTSPQNYTKAHHKDYQHIPEKIYNDTPNVKLIYIVRDPFERILSHSIQNRFGGSLARVKENEATGHYWKTSLYNYQLSFYLKYFRKEQIHILTLEDLKNDKMKELNKIFSFLGITEMEDESLFDFIENDSASKKIPQFIKSKVFYRFASKLLPVATEKYVEKFVQKKYGDFLKKPSLGNLIDEGVVKEIREDALLLSKEWNVDISSWNLEPEL